VWWRIWREELKEAEGRPDGGKSSRVAVDLAGEELVTVDLAGEELVAAAVVWEGEEEAVVASCSRACLHVAVGGEW
jgi:hypothetical protein